jgi:lysine 2,3-aminomutase
MTAPHRPPHPTPSGAITTAAGLVDRGLAGRADAAALDTLARSFRIRVSTEMLAAIAQPDDPVARQFVPDLAETRVSPVALADPIGDRAHQPVPGLTHRYPDRAILHVTQTCDVYCRFCFRRETVGATGPLPADDLEAALAYIARTPAIREVILTGGDPMTLSPRRLGRILGSLAAIRSLQLLRIHSRVPVVAPERIDAALTAALDQRLPVWLVIHTNHAQELTQAARAAIARLNRAGVPLLSQSVLLRGVNDSVAALEDLFRALVALRVKPYYLHHCDLARGAEHFRTSIAEGQALMAALRGRLSGIALPSYVLDIPGGHGKVPIGPGHLTSTPDGWQVRDPRGNFHLYRDP